MRWGSLLPRHRSQREKSITNGSRQHKWYIVKHNNSHEMGWNRKISFLSRFNLDQGMSFSSKFGSFFGLIGFQQILTNLKRFTANDKNSCGLQGAVVGCESLNKSSELLLCQHFEVAKLVIFLPSICLRGSLKVNSEFDPEKSADIRTALCQIFKIAKGSREGMCLPLYVIYSSCLTSCH